MIQSGSLDHVQVVLNNEHRVAHIHQAIQNR